MRQVIPAKADAKFGQPQIVAFRLKYGLTFIAIAGLFVVLMAYQISSTGGFAQIAPKRALKCSTAL